MYQSLIHTVTCSLHNVQNDWLRHFFEWHACSMFRQHLWTMHLQKWFGVSFPLTRERNEMCQCQYELVSVSGLCSWSLVSTIEGNASFTMKENMENIWTHCLWFFPWSECDSKLKPKGPWDVAIHCNSLACYWGMSNLFCMFCCIGLNWVAAGTGLGTTAAAESTMARTATMA